jgi:hypothetical protein
VIVAKAVLDVALVRVGPTHQTEKGERRKRPRTRKRDCGDGDVQAIGWKTKWR